MVQYCSNCGEQADKGDKFCNYCGDRLSEGGQRGSTRNRGSGPPGGTGTIERKGALATLRDAFTWLLDYPVLIGAFLLVSLVDSAGNFISPAFQLFSAVMSLVVGGVAYIYADRTLRDEEPEFGTAVSTVMGRLLSLIGIWIIYGILVVVGLVLFILPGIYLGARLILAFPACVLDGENAFDSLSTSWRVAHGNVGKLIGIFLVSLMATLSVVIVGVVAGGVEAFADPALYLVAAPVFALVTGMLEMAVARVYLENTR